MHNFLRSTTLTILLLFLASPAMGITVISAESSGPAFDSVIVQYDEPYELISATDPFNYSISLPDFHSIFDVDPIDATSVSLDMSFDPLTDPPLTDHFLVISSVTADDDNSSIDFQTIRITEASEGPSAPEPTTLTLAVLTLLSLGMTRRHRRR